MVTAGEEEETIKDQAEDEEDTMARCINWKIREDGSLEKYGKVKKKMETLRSRRIFIEGCQSARDNPKSNKGGI